MRGERVDFHRQPWEERQRPDRGVESTRVLRLPESPVRATTWDAPEAPDPTLVGELTRSNPLRGGYALKLLWIAVRRPLHLDVQEEFHRRGLPFPTIDPCSRIRYRRCRNDRAARA